MLWYWAKCWCLCGFHSQQADNELEKDKLTHVLEAANTDEYIESIAREKLGWVKDGETRFVLDSIPQE